MQSRFDASIERFTRGILKYRWLVMFGSLLAIILVGSGARFLGISNNYRDFFEGDNPNLVAYEELQRIYTKTDNILFVLAPKNGDVFTPNVLTAIEDLTAESWKIPFSIRVNSVTNFQHTEAEDDDLIVADLVEGAEYLEEADFAKARTVALVEPLLKDQLISPTAEVTGVNVTFQFPGEALDEQPIAVSKARELAAELETKYPDIDVHITGFTMLNNAFFEGSMTDMSTLVPMMYAIMLIIMVIALRSLSATIGTFIVITFSIVFGMGVAGWFGVLLTPPSMSAPTIIMTLAIADSIHILVTMITEMRNGRTKYDAIIESMKINFLPVLLTSLTTIIGFLSMNTTEVPPLRHLGNITAAGVLAAFFLSTTFLPAFISVMPLKVKQIAEKASKGDTFFSRFSNFVVAKRRPLLWVSSLTAITLASFIPLNELDDRFVEYFDESTAFRADTDFTRQNLTGIYAMEYSVGADGTNGISDPAYLQKLEDFADWFKAQPGVIHVNSFTDIMKRLNMNLNNDDSTFYRLPDGRELAAQYLLLYEMSLPYGLDLNNQINVDKSATRFTVTVDGLSANEMIALSEAGENWLKNTGNSYMEAFGAGPTLMFSYISSRNINSMIIGGVSALVLISIIMLIAFRDTTIGLLSLIPNLLPIVVGFGIWALTSGVVNLGLSVVFGVTMGIVVDDSIHFLSKYLRARREKDLSPEDAVRYAFKNVGMALLVTTFILFIGFSVLSFSTFSMNSDLGLMTSITIGVALIADFVLLPPLLILIGNRRDRKLKAATVQTN